MRLPARPAGPPPVPVRRARRWNDRRNLALGVFALASTGAVAAVEFGRTWRRGSAPLPTETVNVLGAAATAARETSEITLAGFEASPREENALLNLLGSFVLTFGLVRVSTWSIRSRGHFGPFHDVVVGDRHIHHYIPGLGLALGAGMASILSRDEGVDPWLAVPFGAGLGLTLDESALLLELEDVYWSEEGLLSVQIALLTMAGLASAALTQRLFRRGEEQVLPTVHADSDTGDVGMWVLPDLHRDPPPAS